ncbi:MAG: DUF6265 family protein [Pseudomonadota bacterium]
MNKTIAAITLAMSMALAGAAAAAAADTVAQLAWMEGHWQHQNGKRDTEEHWIAPKGGTMFALNRATEEGRTIEFEFLRIIERDGQLIYVSSPNGRAPVEFPAKLVGKNSVVFENVAHGFPARIIYTAESSEVIIARIEGRIGDVERSKEWRFVRVK